MLWLPGYRSVKAYSDDSCGGLVIPLTSDSSEMAGDAGEIGVSRNLMHSRPSFSPNKRKRSEMERLFAASGDMIVVASKSDLAPRFHKRAGSLGFALAKGLIRGLNRYPNPSCDSSVLPNLGYMRGIPCDALFCWHRSST